MGIRRIQNQLRDEELVFDEINSFPSELLELRSSEVTIFCGLPNRKVTNSSVRCLLVEFSIAGMCFVADGREGHGVF